jgi:tRNA A37 methylthiotransferase MiaB
VAQAEGEEIMRRAPRSIWWSGRRAYHRLPDALIARTRGARAQGGRHRLPAEDKFEHLPAAKGA